MNTWSIKIDLKIIKIALDNNITSFDTARAYGDCEKLIGLANEQFSNMNIITKLDIFQDLNNLSKDISYQKIKDSLLQVINKRIVEANSYPESLGRQIENAIPIN